MAKGNAIAAAVLASAGNPGSAASNSPNIAGLSPLVASYNQMYTVNRPYSPLPRPANVFLNGSFGPLAPIQAMPIDPPREDTGRPDPRRFQYPVSWNLVQQPGTEGFKLADFATLRRLADAYSLARSCVDKRKAEIVGLEWDIVPTDDAERAMVDDDKARADFEKRKAVVKEFFSHPDSDRAKYPTFGSWLSALLEDRFVIDAVAIHLVPPRKKGAGPFGSDIAALDLLDGSGIRPMLSTLGATPKPSAVAYQQYQYGVPRVDMLSVINGDDLDGLGEPEAEFRADQLIYLRESPRDFSPYGLSCVEKALLPIRIGLARQEWRDLYYQDGSIPGMFVTAGPDVSTPQQISQLMTSLNAMAGDIAAKHRIIVLPPGSRIDPQKPAPLADQTDEWIAAEVSMPFGLTPMDLGITPRVSAVQTPSESRELSQINSDKGSQTRVEPVCNDLKAVVFDYVIQQLFKQKDMQFSWGLKDRGKNRQAVIDQGVQLVQVGGKTLDELRIDLGESPYGLPETSVPLVYTATGPVPLQAVAAEHAPGAGPAQGGANPAALPAGQPGQVSDDELTTPAHEAAEDLPETSVSSDGDSAAAAAKQARQAAELEYLGRHLRKGRTVAAFRFDHLPPESAAAAAAARPQGVRAAVEAARQAARAQQHGPAVRPGGQAELRAAAARLGAAAGEAATLARLLTADRETPGAPRAVAKASDDEEHHPGWAGWDRDLDLAGIYAEKISEALTAAVDTRALARQWLAAHPRDAAAKASGPAAAAASAAAAAFLARVRQAIEAALGRVLPGAWTEAWALGQQSARASASSAPVDWAGWMPGDPEAAARVAGPGLADLLASQDAEISGITGTALEDLGDILAEHLSSPETGGPVTYSVDSLAARLRDVLGSSARAQLIARTEIARAVSAAATDTYRDMGVTQVRLSTAGDARVCPVCSAAAARGAVPLGDITPPLHPSCRCSLVSGAPAARARKAAGDPLAGAPSADPETVYRQLAVNYRPEGIGWVRDIPWRGVVRVPLDDIDWEHLDTWAAAHDDHHVARFEGKIRAGHEPNPVVMVQVPGSPTLKVIDGHHRSLARRRLGQPVPAYVGLLGTDSATNPAFRTHLYQVHSGGDPLNKRRMVSKESVSYRPAENAARSCGTCVMYHPDGTCDLVRGDIDAGATCDRWEARGSGTVKALGDEDESRVAFLLLRAPNEDGKPRYLLQLREDGTWGLPGGKSHDGEVPWDTAVREAREELGVLPEVKPSAAWTRAEDDHVVWTYLADLPGLFAPSGDGGNETRGYGWFKRRDVPDLELHPAMAETWGRLDFGDPLLGGKPHSLPPGRPELAATQSMASALARKEARGYDLKPLSCMISLDIPDGLIEPLPGGVDDFHVTVVFCGQPDDRALAEICRRAEAAAAAAPGPLSGVISGLGTFPPSASSDGKTPVWAGVTLPGAEQLREAVADLSASEHLEWHPHVTRVYADLEAGDALPDPLPAVPVTFTHLSVHRADGQLFRYPLGVPADVLAAARKAGNAGNAEPLKRWFESGKGAAFIKWGTENDLTRCHQLASAHMDSDAAWGFCQERHISALGSPNSPKD